MDEKELRKYLDDFWKNYRIKLEKDLPRGAQTRKIYKNKVEYVLKGKKYVEPIKKPLLLRIFRKIQRLLG